MSGVVYGVGALAAVERLDLRLIDLHERLLRQRIRPIVPAAVLAGIWRGRSHLWLSRVLAGCVVLDMTPTLARAAGELQAAAAGELRPTTNQGDLAAACVAVTAVARDAVAVVDGDELARLAGVFGDRLRLHRL